MMTTNIKIYFSLKFKVAKCVGPLHCQNDICPLFVQSSNLLQNETVSNVNSMKNMKVNHHNPMSNVPSIVYLHYVVPPLYIQACQ
jgi:hypothetical protein